MIAICHSFNAESFLERSTAFSPVQIRDQRQYVDHFIETFTSKPCDMIIDHLGRDSPMKGQHRCATGQRFRNEKSRWLRSIMGADESEGLS